MNANDPALKHVNSGSHCHSARDLTNESRIRSESRTGVTHLIPFANGRFEVWNPAVFDVARAILDRSLTEFE
jgi:hypothetical protein